MEIRGRSIWWLSRRFRNKVAEVEARLARQSAERSGRLDPESDSQ